MTSRLLAFIAVALLAGYSGAGEDFRVLKYMRRLNTPAAEEHSLGSFDLDEPLLEAVDKRYADIRILNAKQEETPFLVRIKRERKTVVDESSFSLKALSFEEKPENRIEIVVERKQGDPVPSALVLSTGLSNYEKQVSVFGGNDRSNWRELASNQPIFDYTRFFNLRNNRVEMEPTDFSFYRIEVANISESHQSPIVRIARDRRDDGIFSEIEKTSFTRTDFRIENLVFISKVAGEIRSEAIKRAYPVRGLQVAGDAGRGETIVTFKCGRAPISRLALVTGGVNFSREVITETCVRQPDGRTAWREICSSSVSRIDLGKFKRDSVGIDLPAAQRLDRVRLRIIDRDSPPLDITGVKAEGLVMELVFLKERGDSYNVLYGGANIEAPEYDIAAVLRNAETAATDVYSLSLQADNPDYSGTAAGPFFDSRSVMIAAVVLMVIVLGFILAKAARSVETQP